ncbi:KR domain-containing protein [Amycolatopsis sp. NPDC003731]
MASRPSSWSGWVSDEAHATMQDAINLGWKLAAVITGGRRFDSADHRRDHLRVQVVDGVGAGARGDGEGQLVLRRGVRLGSGSVRVTLDDEAGSPVAVVESLTTRPMAAPDTMLYRPQWIPVPPSAATEPVRTSTEPQIAVRDGVPHVLRITGGTGALGALVARHLVTAHDVRHLLLVSRSGPAAPGAGELLASLRDLGADVRIVAADVADRATVTRLVGSCEPPLTAVVHSAAVVDDGVLSAQTPERLDVVLRPKADAALVLDEVTRHLPSTAFVLFSSVTGVFGKAGQANYAVANRVLDAVAYRRRAAGLPGLSLAWGLWELGTGLGDRISATARRRMRASGVEGLTAEQGLALFDAALGSAEPVLVPVRFDPTVSMAPPTGRSPARLPAPRASWPENPVEPELRKLLRAEVAAVLGHPNAAVIDDDRPFPELGFDSLTVIELRTRLAGLSGIDLPATVVFDRPTVTELARHLLDLRRTAQERNPARSPQENYIS